MGRHSTGIYTIDDCKTINLSYLLNKGFLGHDSQIEGTLSWSRNETKTGSVSIVIDTTLKELSFLKLAYTLTDYETNEKKDLSYKIYLQSVKSNLGKGKRWYFICPSTGKRC